MIIKEKILIYIRTRKTPVTAKMIAQRFGCTHATAVKAMRNLLDEKLVIEVLVAEGNRYVRGIRA